jgi:hypothetical protein
VPTTQTIAVNFSIKVKDPVVRQLTAVTQEFTIDASGEFNPGTYEIHNIPIKIEDRTMFKVELAFPLDDPTVIDLGKASGRLWTSKPLQAHGAPLPQVTQLVGGKVTGQVDIIPTIGVFLCNLLQEQIIGSADAGNVRDMIKTIDVDKVLLNLRQGARLKWDQDFIEIGPNSRIQLVELTVDRLLNYAGQCYVTINALNGFCRLGEKFDCAFASGSANVHLIAQRFNSVITLTLADPDQQVALKHCLFNFGTNKRSSVLSESSLIKLKQLHWQEGEYSGKPLVHLAAAMNLNEPLLEMCNPKYHLTAQFRGTVPSNLELDRSAIKHQTDFYTQTDVKADTAEIVITRPTTKLALKLLNANVGPISFSKSGDLDFSLEKGNAGLSAVRWSSKKRSFQLTTAPPSSVSITNGMPLALGKENGSFHGNFPLSIKLGSAELTGSAGNLKLDKVNGQMVVDVDQEVKLDSDLDFSIIESAFLGKNQAEVKVRGLRLVSKNGQGIAQLKTCSIIVPEKAMLTRIQEELPSEKSFDLHRVIFTDRKWRYKDAVIDRVAVKHLKLEDLSVTKTNQANFAVKGDISVSGTVDKGGLLSVVGRSTKWQSCPWLAAANLAGSGLIKYSFQPNKALSDSSLNYALTLNLPLPKEIDLDWSQVGQGLLGKAEKAMIIHQLKTAGPFRSSQKISFACAGQWELFGKNKKQWQSVRVKNLISKPCREGTELMFAAEAML